MIDTDDKTQSESSVNTAAADDIPSPAEEAERAEKTPDATEASAAFNCIEDGSADSVAERREPTEEAAPPAPAKKQKREVDRTAAWELVGLSVKAIAVALSVFMLIVSILTVAMPIKFMRIYNKLGMTERALNCGDRYIRTRLADAGADVADDMGNFNVLSATPELTDSEMTEALEVCIALSQKLMNEDLVSGDKKSAVYYAEKSELYTREFAGLNSVRAVCTALDTKNLAAVPSAVMRPFVYDSLHNIYVTNFRARVVMGATDKMLYDTGRDGDYVTTIGERAATYGVDYERYTETMLDGYADYIDQLAEYIQMELDRIGVTEPLLNQVVVGEKYMGVLTGDEFSLFVNRASGLTGIYNYLAPFTSFVQAAVDFNTETVNDRLHKLYWLKTFERFSSRFWDMSLLLNYNSGAFGAAKAAIEAEYVGDRETKYKRHDAFRHILFDARDGLGRRSILISDAYGILMKDYLQIAN